MYDLLIVPFLLLGAAELGSATGQDVEVQMQLEPDHRTTCWASDGIRFDSQLELASGKGFMGADQVWFYDHHSCATEGEDRGSFDLVGIRMRWRF